MPRLNDHERRTQQVNAKLTRGEYQWLCSRATRASLRLAEFARSQILRERRTRKAPATINGLPQNPVFLAHVARIGNKLNQIARRLHQFGIVRPDELTDALRAIRDMLRTVADGS